LLLRGGLKLKGTSDGVLQFLMVIIAKNDFFVFGEVSEGLYLLDTLLDISQQALKLH